MRRDADAVRTDVAIAIVAVFTGATNVLWRKALLAGARTASGILAFVRISTIAGLVCCDLRRAMRSARCSITVLHGAELPVWARVDHPIAAGPARCNGLLTSVDIGRGRGIRDFTGPHANERVRTKIQRIANLTVANAHAVEQQGTMILRRCGIGFTPGKATASTGCLVSIDAWGSLFELRYADAMRRVAFEILLTLRGTLA